MIGTINPLVKGSMIKGLRVAFAYLIGMVLGTAVWGTFLVSIGLIINWIFATHLDKLSYIYYFLSVISIFFGFREMDFIIKRFRICQPAKQVPRYWIKVFSPEVTLFFWGFLIGTFFKTMVQYTLYYLICILVIMSADMKIGISVLCTYGLTQSTILIIELLSIKLGMKPADGLLGEDRTIYLFNLVGLSMIGFGLIVLLQRLGFLPL
jgi:hypothetical protein